MSGVKIPHKALVLVGDGEKAIVLRNEGDEVYPNLVVEELFEQENPPTREQGTDRPGRASDALGHKSAVDNTDWHQLEKHRFAKEIANRLYKLAHAGRFDRLVVAAPPSTLGDLREAFHPEVRNRVIAEFDKTLTQHPVDQIERILTGG